MYTLFLDTHGSEIIVSLYDGVSLIEKRQESEHSHAKFLCPMIDSILKDNDKSFKDISDIVVINGPGSFTGIRIGLSVAKVIAYSLKIPIRVISTLRAFMVSDGIDDKRMAVMEDNKGYYICFNDNDERYVENIDDYKDYRIVSETIDVIKVIEYSRSIDECNVHFIRANYVKKIEAEK